MNLIKIFFVITTLFFTSHTALAATTVWDFSNPLDYTISNINELGIANNTASLIGQTAGLTLLGNYDTINSYAVNASLAPDGNTIYLSSENRGLDMVDVSDPTNPSFINNIEANFSNVASSVSPDGNTLYLANAFYGLQIVDISDPLNPTVLTTYRPSPGYIRGVTLSSDLSRAYLGINARGGAVEIVDITDPTNIISLGSYVNGVGAEEMLLTDDGNILFAAAGYDGLLILDVSDPTNPTPLANYYAGYAIHLALSDDENTVYLASGDAGLHIIDVSDLTNPTLIADYSGAFDYVNDVKLSLDGNTAYLADGGNGLRVLDISDPLNVTVIDTLDTSYSAQSVTLSADGTIAYVTDGEDGLDIISLGGSSFPTTNPYLYPLNTQSFSGTLLNFKAKEGLNHEGKLRYQVSTDNGATWYFFKNNTGTWEQTTRTDGTQVSTERQIRQNLGTLDTDGGVFTWRAYFKSNGLEQVELDWVKVKFTN